MNFFKLLGISGFLFCSFNIKVNSQIIGDQTLPVNSVIRTEGNLLIIEQGTRSGNNLFHSFKEFTLESGQAAQFNNALSIENIFGRVTGTNVSHINGLLKANGTANLFLMNPNGIIFGKNSSLNIGGSFFATTGNRITFSDGAYYQASAASPSILTINVPIGIDLTDAKGIVIQGNGHSLVSPYPLPVSGSKGVPNLKVISNQSIFLVGNGISLEGGVILGSSGAIRLVSVAQGTVKLDLGNKTIDTTSVGSNNFQDIFLSKRSLIDATGFTRSGEIELQGRDINSKDGSVLLLQNLGNQDSGAIRIKATNLLRISGTDPNARILGSFRTETLGLGRGGDLIIDSPNIELIQGSQLFTATFSSSKGGNIFLHSSNLDVIGTSPRTPNAVSTIITLTVGEGQSGNLTLFTKDLSLRDGGTITNSTLGSGDGGIVKIQAERITASGIEPSTGLYSGITSLSLNNGKGGEIFVEANQISFNNGAKIDSGSFASGHGGNIYIKATDFLDLSNTTNNRLLIPSITSSSRIVDESLQKLFNLPPIPMGNAGNIEIHSNQLNLSNLAEISSRNEGLGQAGNIKISVYSLNLFNSNLSSFSNLGQGGNVTINAQESLLQKGSFIRSTAGGLGSGGDINLNSHILILGKNTYIEANAFEGSGGNININAPSFFQSENSSITASSQLGIDGTVVFNTTPYNFDVSNREDPTQVTPAQIALKSCYDYGQRLIQIGEGITRRDNNRSGRRTYDDLIPLGQVVSTERLPDGRVRLLTCKEFLKSILPQN